MLLAHLAQDIVEFSFHVDEDDTDHENTKYRVGVAHWKENRVEGLLCHFGLKEGILETHVEILEEYKSRNHLVPVTVGKVVLVSQPPQLHRPIGINGGQSLRNGLAIHYLIINR
jgi:hypothetical protein